ncbi:MAG: OmpA family protein, partial [Flavobacteriales bacterium]|nr:OmpA family protein [Flavobacteriales bacterium]
EIVFNDLMLYGMVTDAKTKEPLSGVQAVIIDNVSGEMFTFKTLVSGEFKKKLSTKKPNEKCNYNIELSKEGYFPKILTYDTIYYQDGQIRLSDVLDFSLALAVKNLSDLVKINDIRFDVNKADIRPDAGVELDKIVKIMNEYDLMVVELGSHSDCRGSAKYNMKLSDDRAKASASYIKQKITNPDRLTGVGYGESELVNRCACEGAVRSDCSDEEHAKNRRTTFKVISTGSDLLKVGGDDAKEEEEAAKPE